MKIATNSWTPTIIKVENGYVITVKSPNQDCDIYETYVFSNCEAMTEYLYRNFEGTDDD